MSLFFRFLEKLFAGRNKVAFHLHRSIQKEEEEEEKTQCVSSTRNFWVGMCNAHQRCDYVINIFLLMPSSNLFANQSDSFSESLTAQFRLIARWPPSSWSVTTVPLSSTTRAKMKEEVKKKTTKRNWSPITSSPTTIVTFQTEWRFQFRRRRHSHLRQRRHPMRRSSRRDR